ncbi:hypothetical protein CV102_15205 [Natronococcus pandeyae]|uniref:Uncharacterized protein n=1 Tax=Natronococcus pandeyae TaxID=2055836 RepID=A0A8J8Q3B4_9EURY|nr:hypothetical protein [Natronococcus pandeyae]TYL37683.1 hypothetical protein CV102_15205 [Natronococcus pandeyae]
MTRTRLVLEMGVAGLGRVWRDSDGCGGTRTGVAGLGRVWRDSETAGLGRGGIRTTVVPLRSTP